MKADQLVAQFYTIRDFCRTSAEVAAAAKKIKAIGFAGAELAGLGTVPEVEMVRIMTGEGLVISASHEPPEEILRHPETCIARVQALGCSLAIYPYPKNVDFTREVCVDAWIEQLAVAGEKFYAAGLMLGYHNHGLEFVQCKGRTILELIFARIDPRHLAAELDTYWVHYGGGDVTDWCRRLRDRLPALHLKDYGFTAENKPTDCEMGRGTLPFPKIIAEAEASGCRWFTLEQDTCPGNPFVSLQESYDYVRAHLLESA